MRTSFTRAAMLIALSLTFAASIVTIASAKGPGGGGVSPRGFSHGQASWKQAGGTPPGWQKGHKVGWGTSRTSPPGWR